MQITHSDRALWAYLPDAFLADNFDIIIDATEFWIRDANLLEELFAIKVLDYVNQRVVWEFNRRNSRELEIAGTAVLIQHASSSNGRRIKNIFQRDRKYNQSLAVVSTGLDPQLIFPRLPGDVGFPLMLSIEMKLIPCE